ncbi:MAG: transposase [Oligoflexia bacterium]|nr:transposase [Oligoflexia bacterium]
MNKEKKDTEMITYQFRLRPTKAQTKILARWMGACRFLYNCALEQRVMAYEMTGKSLNYFSQQNELPDCKKIEEFSWLKEVPSQSLQMSLRHLDRAYRNFFEGRAGFPKRKKKGRCTDAICFPQAGKIQVGKITNKKSVISGLPKLKGGIKLIQHRPIEGKPKVATISRKAHGEWYISITCEKNVADCSAHGGELSVKKAIGIDLGVVKTIVTTKKDHNLDLRKIKQLEKEIAKIQRRLSKPEVKKFSKKWHYYQKIVRKKHTKISRIRKNFLHEVSKDICKNHAIVCMENLKVKNMSKSASGTIENPGKMVSQKSGLNRSILRQGWGMFRQFCEYKTKRYGSHLELVSPKNTSRICSSCGHTCKENRLSQSEFLCQNCGYEENADKNAANNILALGLESMGLSTLEALTIATSVA